MNFPSRCNAFCMLLCTFILSCHLHRRGKERETILLLKPEGTCSFLCQIRFKSGSISTGVGLETQFVLYSLVCFRFQALLYFTGELLVPGSKTLCAGAIKPQGNFLSLLLLLFSLHPASVLCIAAHLKFPRLGSICLQQCRGKISCCRVCLAFEICTCCLLHRGTNYLLLKRDSNSRQLYEYSFENVCIF